MVEGRGWGGGVVVLSAVFALIVVGAAKGAIFRELSFLRDSD